MTSGSGVVVTGAARGIGRALAARAVASGARVVVNDLDPEQTLATAEEIGAIAIAGDAATADGAAALVQGAREALGYIDTWFANAGVMRGVGLQAAEAEWSSSLEVNVMAHVRAARLLVPHWMHERGGRFVVTASAAGLLTALGSPTYSVSKHAAVAFAEWLSASYSHRGVVVQVICPQGVHTDLLARTGPIRDFLTAQALTPEDVAEATFAAMADDRFLILPHPKVADYYRARATDTDQWLSGMNRLQQRLEAEDRSPQGPNPTERPITSGATG